jgi:hypothetical protein
MEFRCSASAQTPSADAGALRRPASAGMCLRARLLRATGVARELALMVERERKSDA